jgi:hypothetical protein
MFSISVCAFFCVCVRVEALRRADHPSKESYRLSKIEKKKPKWNGEFHGGKPRPTGAVVPHTQKKKARNAAWSLIIKELWCTVSRVWCVLKSLQFTSLSHSTGYRPWTICKFYAEDGDGYLTTLEQSNVKFHADSSKWLARSEMNYVNSLFGTSI